MLQRNSLRRDVATEILDRLASGRLPDGRLNETWLAAELGISRTPLREALHGLVQRGLLVSSMGRGFFITPLHAREARELYPLLGALEALAVRSSGLQIATKAPALSQILLRMAEASDLDAILALSQAWSNTLLSACGNNKLLGLLDDLHRLAARYERAALQRGFSVPDALASHQRIVDTLARGELELAAQLISATWDSCLAALLDWLPELAVEHPAVSARSGAGR